MPRWNSGSGRRFAPARARGTCPIAVIAVPDIPRTRSGKLVELAVRDVVNGREVKNVGALANPEALDHFRKLTF